MDFEGLVDKVRVKNPDIDTRAAAKRILRSLIQILRDAALRGEDINLPGYGKLRVKKYGTYIAKTPYNPEGVEIPPRSIVLFSQSKGLKRALRGGAE